MRQTVEHLDSLEELIKNNALCELPRSAEYHCRVGAFCYVTQVVSFYCSLVENCVLCLSDTSGHSKSCVIFGELTYELFRSLLSVY